MTRCRMRGFRLVVASSLLMGVASVCDCRHGVATEASTASHLGKKIDAFALSDLHGKPVSLAQFQDAKAIVVAFLGAECPLAKIYAPRLAELAKEFAPQGVA